MYVEKSINKEKYSFLQFYFLEMINMVIERNNRGLCIIYFDFKWKAHKEIQMMII